MILLPAVDIRDGKAVRLRQGHFDEETVYADDPLEAARSFVEAGARFLHVVDLDGAREGEPVNLAPRRADRARAATCRWSSAAGCARSPSIRARAQGRRRARRARHRRLHRPRPARRGARGVHPRVWSAVDVRGGQRVGRPAGRARPRRAGEDAIRRMQQRGVTRFVYTNVDRDGMLEGPDLDEVRRVGEAVRGRFLYSGGIGSLEDLRALRDAAAGQPGRRDLRQGALRGALRRSPRARPRSWSG